MVAGQQRGVFKRSVMHQVLPFKLHYLLPGKAEHLLGLAMPSSAFLQHHYGLGNTCKAIGCKTDRETHLFFSADVPETNPTTDFIWKALGEQGHLTCLDPWTFK